MIFPIRYAGGKRRALKHILPHIPEGERIVSPFLGGGAVEIAVAARGQRVWACDIFHPLMAYWGAQLYMPNELANRLNQWRPIPETYKMVKERLRKHWTGEKKMIDIKLAAHYYFNHNLSYGPGFLGWQSKVYQCPIRYKRMVKRVREFKCPNLAVGLNCFTETISENRSSFLYCDPPYYLGEGSKVFRGIYPQRNFPIHHKDFDHEGLRDLLLAHKGGFVLSYNDCEQIRDWYADFEIRELSWHYSMGQGEKRIGKNRKALGGNHVKKSSELLIVKR